MFKKVFFVMLALLIATQCFAQLQSGPSNKVGYVKIAVSLGTSGTPSYKPFGLPFKFWDVVGNIPQYGVPATNGGTYRPSYIVGDQAVGGSPSAADRIMKQGGGLYASRSATGVWSGSLETGQQMEPGRAYWFCNKHAATSLVLAGEVANIPLDSTIGIGAPATAGSVSTPISWRLSRVDSVKKLNLVGATPGTQFTGGSPSASDRLMAQVGGAYATCNASYAWSTTGLQVITPGEAYWIINKHVNHPWTYRWLNTGTTFEMQQLDHRTIATPNTKTITTVEKSVAPTSKAKAIETSSKKR